MGKGLIAVALSVCLCGCVGFESADKVRQDASAGLIGCPPQEIVVSNHQKLTWTAACRGKTFQCTAGDGTSCTRMLDTK